VILSVLIYKISDGYQHKRSIPIVQPISIQKIINLHSRINFSGLFSVIKAYGLEGKIKQELTGFIQ